MSVSAKPSIHININPIQQLSQLKLQTSITKS